MPDQVWGITMVRDEVDVIEGTLRHLASEGLDGIIVADNNSDDGTNELVRELDIGCELVCMSDPEIGYYQSRKMTALMAIAQAKGAVWVVPFDADELWYSKNDERMIDTIRGIPQGIDYVAADLYNHFGTSSDDRAELDPFRRIRYVDWRAGALPKVVLRADMNLTIAMGNHGVTGERDLNFGGTHLALRHFPWRTPEQFESKIRNGLEAYRATDLGDDFGAHWRQYGEILESQGPDALRDNIFYRWFFDPPEIDLTDDPAPYMRWS